jgi:hypothetical protein
MDITFEEIKQILAEIVITQKVQSAELAASKKANDEELAAIKKANEASFIASKKAREDEFDKIIKANEAKLLILKEKTEEANRLLAIETADLKKTIKQTNKQLGELGNKLGSFTEGLAFPTVERIMLNEMGMTFVTQNARADKGGDSLEIDVLGYSNGSINKVIIGEIKSHFREENIEQLETACEKVSEFMPEHRGKSINGMMIFVKGEKIAIQNAIKKGFYVVQANDENFKLLTPPKFVARDFSKV